jgi:hypothetical protein
MKTVTYLLAMIGGLYALLIVTSGLMSLLGI